MTHSECSWRSEAHPVKWHLRNKTKPMNFFVLSHRTAGTSDMSMLLYTLTHFHIKSSQQLALQSCPDAYNSSQQHSWIFFQSSWRWGVTWCIIYEWDWREVNNFFLPFPLCSTTIIKFRFVYFYDLKVYVPREHTALLTTESQLFIKQERSTQN